MKLAKCSNECTGMQLFFANASFSHGKVTIIWKYLYIYGEQRTTKFRIIYYTKLSEGTTRWTRRINDGTSNDGEVCTLRWKKRTKAKGGLSRASNPLEDDGFYIRIEFFFSFLFFSTFSVGRWSIDCTSFCRLLRGFFFVPFRGKKRNRESAF